MEQENKDTRYQEGILEFSNGIKVPILFKPLSTYFTPEEMENITLSQVLFMPEEDLANSFISKALDETKEIEEKEDSKQQDKIDKGYKWDDDVI